MLKDKTENIEWKLAWKDEYLKLICGFANAFGGKLYIGVDDDGRVVGIHNAQELLESLPNKMRDALGIVVDINLLIENDLEYIEIIVQSYPMTISYKGHYYYHSGSTVKKLIGTELESFLLRKRGVTWEHMPFPGFEISDLDLNAIEHFKQLAIIKQRIDKDVFNKGIENLLNQLRLKNYEYLTNAAALLFTKDPEKYFTGAFIKVGFFENDANILYQDEVHGPLLEQVDKTMDLILCKYMKAKILYEGGQRIKRYFVKKEGLREAILNAVINKQYESGIPIQMSVYKDKIYIGYDGRIPKDLYDSHTVQLYNPDIAYVFFLAGEIEVWGESIKKIHKCCEENNYPIPIYHIHPNDIMIQFNAPEKV